MVLVILGLSLFPTNPCPSRCDDPKLPPDGRRLLQLTLSGPEMTKTTHAPRHTEIGILLYPGCAMASVHGLTDAFQVGNDYARQHGGADRIRTSHWRVDEGSGTRAFD